MYDLTDTRVPVQKVNYGVMQLFQAGQSALSNSNSSLNLQKVTLKK